MPRYKSNSDSEDEVDVNIDGEEICADKLPLPLMTFQRNNVNIVNSMIMKGVRCMLNMCMGGAGKTLQTLQTVLELEAMCIIIAPAKSIQTWLRESATQRVMDRIFAIASYNSFAAAKLSRFGYKNDKVVLTDLNIVTRKKINPTSKYYNYTYSLPCLDELFESESLNRTKYLIFVFDECHRITTHSNASRAALALFKYILTHPESNRIRFIGLSGTLIEKLERLAVYAFFCGYIDMPTKARFNDFMMLLSGTDGANNPVSEFRKLLFTEGDRRAVTVSREEMDLGYPNFIECIRIDADDDIREKIAAANNNIRLLYQETQNAGVNQLFLLHEIQRERQVLSGLKPPFMASFAKIALKKGYSVCVYFCFIEPLNEFVRLMKNYHPMVISGKTKSMEERDNIQWRFCHNAYEDKRKKTSPYECRLLAITTGTGSESISLHDKVGTPHLMLYDIDWTLTVNIQQRWRAYRLGLKSGVRQYYIMWKGTYEEHIAEILNKKNDVLTRLNEETISKEQNNLFAFSDEVSLDYDSTTKILTLVNNDFESLIPDIDEELLTMKQNTNATLCVADESTDALYLPTMDVQNEIESTPDSTIRQTVYGKDVKLERLADQSVTIYNYPSILDTVLKGYNATIVGDNATVPFAYVADVEALIVDLGLLQPIASEPQVILGNEEVKIQTDYVNTILILDATPSTRTAIISTYPSAIENDDTVSMAFDQVLLENICIRLNVVSISHKRSRSGKGKAPVSH